jgi:hypothetical protein
MKALDALVLLCLAGLLILTSEVLLQIPRDIMFFTAGFELCLASIGIIFTIREHDS